MQNCRLIRAHQPGPKLRDQLRRFGDYWLKMITDTIAYAKRCHACLIHGDFVHQAPGHLLSTSSSCPLQMWGMDVIGLSALQHPKDIASYCSIIDYFSKWAEAVPWKKQRHQMWSSSLSITCSTALVYPEESCTIMVPNSSVKLSRGSVTNSEYKVCHQRYIIQPLTASQKP